MKMKGYKKIIAMIMLVAIFMTMATGCEITVPEEPKPLPTAMPTETPATQTAEPVASETPSPLEVKHSVFFTTSGGTGSMETMQFKAGEEFEVPDCVFLYPGYKFAGYWDGWKYVNPGETYTMISQDITLSAQWKKASGGGGGGGGGGGSHTPATPTPAPAAPTPKPTPAPTATPVSANNENESTVVGEVKIETSENICDIFTADELESEAEKKVSLKVADQSGISVTQQGAIDTMNKDQSAKWQYENHPIFDITLTKQVGDGDAVNVTDLGKEKVTITIDVPAEYLSDEEERVFSLIRIHDGVAEALKDTDDKPETITIETNQFSPYVLAYKIVYNHDNDTEGDFGFVDTDGDGRDDNTGLDQFLTDPTPDGKPAPVEPENSNKSEVEYTATLTIRCNTILDNLDELDDELKHYFVSEDGEETELASGVILEKHEIVFYEGESVNDVLLRETKKYGIHMEESFTPIYNSAYVEGIYNLYEFSCGALSGWMYSVNGWYPNYGCSRYVLQEGDEIEWNYTCDLGADLEGGEWLGNA